MSRKRARTCRGKRRYRDRQEALSAIRFLGRISRRAKIPHRAYWCQQCNGWHTTSQDKRTAT